MEIFGHKKKQADISKERKKYSIPEGFELIRGASILLVDDNPINQILEKDLLEREGFNIYTAENGAKGLEKIQAQDLVFDLVLMDLQMPVMDGFTAAKKIREWEHDRQITDGIPIIALTADAMKGVKEKVYSAGMNDYITKPIDATNLFIALVKLIKPRERKINIPEKPLQTQLSNEIPEIEGINVENGLMRVAGDLSSYQWVLKSFYKKNLNTIANIKQALLDQDINTALRLTHTLKGVSGSIGAKELFENAKTLQYAFREGVSQSECSVHLEILEKNLNQVLFSIKEWEAQQKPVLLDMKKNESFDLKKAESLIEDLKLLLEDNDTKAIDVLDSFKQLFPHVFAKNKFNEVEKLVNEFQFEEALKIIHLGIKF